MNKETIKDYKEIFEVFANSVSVPPGDLPEIEESFDN